MVWIEKLGEHVIDLSLSRMRAFIGEYGKPEYDIIHVQTNERRIMNILYGCTFEFQIKK